MNPPSLPTHWPAAPVAPAPLPLGAAPAGRRPPVCSHARSRACAVSFRAPCSAAAPPPAARPRRGRFCASVRAARDGRALALRPPAPPPPPAETQAETRAELCKSLTVAGRAQRRPFLYNPRPVAPRPLRSGPGPPPLLRPSPHAAAGETCCRRGAPGGAPRPGRPLGGVASRRRAERGACAAPAVPAARLPLFGLCRPRPRRPACVLTFSRKCNTTRTMPCGLYSGPELAAERSARKQGHTAPRRMGPNGRRALWGRAAWKAHPAAAARGCRPQKRAIRRRSRNTQRQAGDGAAPPRPRPPLAARPRLMPEIARPSAIWRSGDLGDLVIWRDLAEAVVVGLLAAVGRREVLLDALESRDARVVLHQLGVLRCVVCVCVGGRGGCGWG